MKKIINSIIKRAYGTVLMLLTLVAASCSSEDEPQPADGQKVEEEPMQGLEQDEDGMIMLHRDLKVKANTNFTMEEFEQEFFSHDTWEEVTIGEYKDGIWSLNFLAKEHSEGWYYPNCYEFHSDGSANEYHWPAYIQPTDTIRYIKIDYSIDPMHRSLKYTRTFKRENDQYAEYTQTFKIVAVDEGRIVLDGSDLRRSIEPHEKISGEKIQVGY